MKGVVLLLLLLLPVISFAQGGNDVTVLTLDTFTKRHDPGVNISLEKHWKYHDGDIPSASAMEFNDSSWKITSPWLLIDKQTKTTAQPFSGIGWFRLHFSVDSSMVSRSFALRMMHFGASEVYLDGGLVIVNGVINGKDSSVYYDPQYLPFPINLLKPGEHVLAVRYANYKAQRNFSFFYSRFAGFEMKIGQTAFMIQQDHWHTRANTFLDILLFGIFIALAVLHLFLYLYNRSSKTNLFFSVFSFSLGMSFLLWYFNSLSTSPTLELVSFTILLIVILPAICASLSGFVYNLYSGAHFKYKFIKVISSFNFVLIACLLVPVVYAINESAGIIMLIYLGNTVLYQVIIRLGITIYRKKPGSRLIGTGVLFFTGFALFCFIYSNFNGGLSFDDSTVSGMLFLFTAIAAILSLPVSISLFLAWSVGNINKELKGKLDEVNQLSEKTLQQELEKQKMLESQKEDLEREVAVRTTEVVAQKERIEKQNNELTVEKNRSELLLKDIQVKNKAITDNINYAQRIQSAILPDVQLISKVLTDSFILFLPKDIVSGDFYAFAEKNGRVIVIAGDCTGHGVSGAFMSMIASSLLNQVINERGVVEPSQILNLLNISIIETLRQSENESNDGMDIAICSFDLNHHELQYAGANRPLWVIRKEQIATFAPDKFPIGGLQMARDRTFTSHNIQLEEGDTIYIFTDGYADQFGGTNGKKLMTAKFKEMLLNIQSMNMKEQDGHLRQYFEQWKGSNEQVDDVLVIGVRV